MVHFVESYITEWAVNLLKLPRGAHDLVLSGIGGRVSKAKGQVGIAFESVADSRTFQVDPFILPKLTADLPCANFTALDEYKKLHLADPNYWQSGRIDLLLGAEVVQVILLPGMSKGALLAQETHVVDLIGRIFNIQSM